MTEEELKELGPGDVVRHCSDNSGAIVTANYGERVTAVRTYDLTNATEWILVAKASYKHKES